VSVAAVVVAAGRGVRFGGAKQFETLHNETVTAHSVRAARSVAPRVVLVVPSSYDGDGEGADVVVIGGDTRASSVRAGLVQCGDADVIVVHDAARPLASVALFHAVVEAVRAGADAAVPGLAITDTVKRVTREGSLVIVHETVPRDELMTVQMLSRARTRLRARPPMMLHWLKRWAGEWWSCPVRLKTARSHLVTTLREL
jgi:2-C-methyl-D-erythritol 4-phosphate cytidylyltransferase